ncbi:MAG TPA: hypothetical protein PLB50_07915 [Candidatus Saccharicenans sp.]|jgi:hypothetical protein|nr:hypothetical protein [Candidatus Saccharicenans sp.]HNT01380.1 hypothetical protein [Candidatus Saccharicenans sp.]HPB59709.1 hypothetical protein [Candidatus Saccharicenans sp.]HQO76592.1 hypothetical protein [Candidatus Saccharicenans sp.]HUM79783.1 hypothetical protein [Candidatus Saccharicenans sp.]
MKLKTKLVIFFLAVVISLTGFGLIASGINIDRLLQVARPTIETTFTMTQILS